MVVVNPETTYYRNSGVPKNGYYINETLKHNLDNYLIKGVNSKFDGVVLFTGMEGSGKSTIASMVARYVDPSFPGPELNDGTGRRAVDRIVYTPDQIMKAIDTAKPGQAILIDEAVISFGSQDAGSEIQKILIKKFVTIRKLRLYLFIVIPSIFLLRKYFAIFRTRACIHAYCPDGISRGAFSFYSHRTKRQLYIRGVKEFDQGVVKPDFRGRFTNTEGFFYDVKHYDAKKQDAIDQITSDQEGKGQTMSKAKKKLFTQRNILMYDLYNREKTGKDKFTIDEWQETLIKKFGELMEFKPTQLKTINQNAIKDLGLSSSVTSE